MADIEAGLVTYIEAQVPTAGKGYPLVVPQDLTGWAYQMLPAKGEDLAHDGPTGFFRGRFQITLEGSGETPYADAKAKAKAIRQALHGYKGLMGSVPVEFCYANAIEDDRAEALKLPVQRLDVKINYRE